MKDGLIPGMRGNVSEFNDHGQTRFIEVHTYRYNEAEFQRLKEINCLESSQLETFLKLIQDEIPPNTPYLYKLQTYLGETDIDDLWEFNDRISDFEEFGFYEIESLLKFCHVKWGITKESFRPIEETNIPS